MRWLRVGLHASSMCMCVGLLLVVLVVYFIILPLKQATNPTVCNVLTISGTDSSSLPAAAPVAAPPAQEPCPKVTVTHTTQDGTARLATLVAPSGCVQGLQVHDKVACAIRPEGHFGQLDSFWAMQALLWPSVMFIGGFVGLVLTSIHLQAESVLSFLPRETLLLSRIIQPTLLVKANTDVTRTNSQPEQSTLDQVSTTRGSQSETKDGRDSSSWTDSGSHSPEPV